MFSKTSAVRACRLRQSIGYHLNRLPKCLTGNQSFDRLLAAQAQWFSVMSASPFSLSQFQTTVTWNAR